LALVVRPEAEDDVVDAAAWYERRSEGLGVRFSEEVMQYSTRWPKPLCYTAAAIQQEHSLAIPGALSVSIDLRSNWKEEKTVVGWRGNSCRSARRRSGDGVVLI